MNIKPCLSRQAVGENPITPGYAGYGWSLGIRDTSGSGLRSDTDAVAVALTSQSPVVSSRVMASVSASCSSHPIWMMTAARPSPVSTSWVDSENRAQKLAGIRHLSGI